jgi:hypothetical protein
MSSLDTRRYTANRATVASGATRSAPAVPRLTCPLAITSAASAHGGNDTLTVVVVTASAQDHDGA